jgi:uncharacterized repeat protein (TIGR03803 family)
MKLKMFFFLALIAVVALFTPIVQAQTFSDIHDFTGGSDGRLPVSGVTIKGGKLYGTTSAGGTFAGVVYEAAPAGSDWDVSTLSFLQATGNAPDRRPVFGPDGHLYGVTVDGGINTRNGNVYELVPSATICKTAFCSWIEIDLHDFTFQDGANPTEGDLVWDQQGNIYGTTANGGAFGNGVVYEMMRSQNGWTAMPIYSFSGGSDGKQPAGGVVFDSNGNLFGTTSHGGSSNHGVVFELTYVPGVGWTEKVIYTFQGSTDGSYPYSGVIFDNAGNLYGSTFLGGGGQGGTVFEISPSGDSWNFNLIYPLRGTAGPQGSLTMDAAGNLYGAASGNGNRLLGNVFKLTKTGNSWTYTSLHDFGGSDGEDPICSVAIDTDGTLYGTTQSGGLHDGGTLWQIKP